MSTGRVAHDPSVAVAASVRGCDYELFVALLRQPVRLFGVWFVPPLMTTPLNNKGD
jgi:hypothetical protein